MRLASKINAAIIAAFACGTAVTYAVLETTIRPRFDDIERAAARANHQRVTDAFQTFTDKLQTAAQDYAFWDENYAFLQNEKVDEFIATNLTPEYKTVANLGVNALLFLRSDGTVQWGAAHLTDESEPLTSVVQEIAHFSRSHPGIGATTPSARGIIRTSKGLLLIAIAPALRTDESGPAVGKVIAGKFLDVDAAKQLTGVDFDIEPIPQLTNAASLPEGVVLSTQSEMIETMSILRNLVGRPLGELKVKSTRDVSQAGAAAMRSAMLMMILAGVLSLGVLWAFLSKVVAARIEALRSHFGSAATDGRIALTNADLTTDEIGDLARSFNVMADQVNHLRDALADSSYMSGLSDWAAGTLHNVRNGLAPVVVSSWQVKQLFDKDWISNVDTAVAEHGSTAVDPVRREKLNTYLIGSADRFAVAAKEAAGLVDKIQDASQSVLDIVAEFERYAHRKVAIEPVQLAPLIKRVADAHVTGPSPSIKFDGVETDLIVDGNGVILRQVFSNIFVNAVEAMKNQEAGSIAVKIETSENRTARVSITDNGEGVTPERLAGLFMRGGSTRVERSGGLGLHWCANAVKVLGGSIRAESAGEGLGTTLIVELPINTMAKRVAA